MTVVPIPVLNRPSTHDILVNKSCFGIRATSGITVTKLQNGRVPRGGAGVTAPLRRSSTSSSARAGIMMSGRLANGLGGSIKAGSTALLFRDRAGSCAPSAAGCNACGCGHDAGGPGAPTSDRHACPGDVMRRCAQRGLNAGAFPTRGGSTPGPPKDPAGDVRESCRWPFPRS